MRIQEALGLARPPVAIGFFDTPPANVPKWNGGPVPAGCAFWREAMKGRTFYTEPADHYNCAVGSYTHGIALPAERAGELQATLGFMAAQGYIEMAEVPGIPTLAEAPAYIAYGPAEAGGFAPDVVVVAARPAAAMLLYEAVLRAGAGNALMGVLGRPGCAVLPLARNSGAAALSFGCRGNRTFTGLGDNELYVAVPGCHWAAVASRVEGIVAANDAMEQYYRGREAQFPIL